LTESPGKSSTFRHPHNLTGEIGVCRLEFALDIRSNLY
jgi:hypothetical protein